MDQGANNLSIEPEAHANHTVSLLKTQFLDAQVETEEHFVPGCWISFENNGQQVAKITSTEGEAFTLDFSVAHPGEWLSLNLSLGGFSLAERSIIGFVCNVSSPRPLTLRPCIRSGSESGFLDCFFDKHVIAYEQKSTHVDILEVGRPHSLPAEAQWRDLLFFMKPETLTVTFHDLKIFIV